MAPPPSASSPGAAGSAASMTPAGCLVRTLWMFWGNIALLGMVAMVARDSGGGFTLWDVGVVALVGVLVLVRYVDVTKLHGSTAEGDPATPEDFRRYALKVVAGGMGLLAAAHVLGFLIKK